MVPGTPWTDCHRAAEREIVRSLLALGLLQVPASSGKEGDAAVEEVVAAQVGAVFFPHGLGHLIGCDTHDVGG